MEDVIDLTRADETVPARAHEAEPIGVNVCTDVVDLCESDDEGRQEQQQHTLPQHFDWDYIAERRAAYSAVQSLSALTQPETASAKPQSSSVTRNVRQRKQTAKVNGKRAASQALDEKSPQRKKKRKNGGDPKNPTINDRKSLKGNDHNSNRKKNKGKSTDENPSRRNKKKRKQVDGIAKKEDASGPRNTRETLTTNKRKSTDENPSRRNKKKRKQVDGIAKKDDASGPRNTREILTTTTNKGRSHHMQPEGVSSKTERNRRKRQRAKQNKRARSQNYAAFEEFNYEPPLSRERHLQSNSADQKANVGEENLSHHIASISFGLSASISDRVNQEHNLEPTSRVHLNTSSKMHGVPFCHNVSDIGKSSREHDPVPINREIKFENLPQVYVDNSSQNCKPPASFVAKYEHETSPAHPASISPVFGALNDNKKPAEVDKTSWHRVPPTGTTGHQTMKRVGCKTFKYCAHCPTKGRVKGQGRWTRHFADEHNKNKTDNEPQALSAAFKARQQAQHQSGAQQTPVFHREEEAPSLSNHVEATVTIKADRDGLVCKEEQHDDAQDKSNENGQPLSDTDPGRGAREINFQEHPVVFANSSPQSCKPQESDEVKHEIEASSAETAGILSASAAPNDRLQKQQHQSGVQKTSVLGQKDEVPLRSNHVEATDTAEVNRDGIGFKEEQQDNSKDTSREHVAAVSDNGPDLVDKQMKFESEPDVYGDSRSQSCRPPASFEVKNENETSSVEPASISSVPAAPNDRLEKVEHQSGTQQTPIHQNDKSSSPTNHVEAADSAEADRAVLVCKEEQHDDAQYASKDNDQAVSDTAPDPVQKEIKFKNEADVCGDNRFQNCKQPASFEVKHEKETSPAESTSNFLVSTAINDQLEKVEHPSGTQQTPVDQTDKSSSSSNHVEAADSVEADRARLGRKEQQHDPAVSGTDDLESMLLKQSYAHAEEGRAPLWGNVDENEVSSIKAMPSVSVDEKLQKDKNQTNVEQDKIPYREDESPVLRTDIDNETVNSSEIGRTYEETKELPRVDAHVSLNDMRSYWDSMDDGVVSEESRSRVSGSKEQKTPAAYTRKDFVSERQVPPHESHDSCVYDDGSVVFVKETQGNVRPAEKATKPPTAHGRNVIDLSGVGSPDRRGSSRKRSNERMAFSKESLNSTSCPDSKHGSSLGDLIRNNGGKGSSAKVKKPAPPSLEGKSWRSTVIIIDSIDDEDANKHDASNHKGVGPTSEDTGIGSSNKNGSTHQGFWEAAPRQPSAARKPAARKRTKKTPTYNAEHFNRSTQYNFTFSETEAHREQERLLREAAARVRQGLAMNVSHPAPFVADANIPDISKLNQNHWKSTDPYARLGLPRGASINIIKSRYRRLALKYHPDKSNFEHTTARFQAVTEAYKLLTGMG